MVSRSRKRHLAAIDKPAPVPSTDLTENDFTCPICLQLLIQPVVLPCKHEFCLACFECHMKETSLLCPMCRLRISVWARQKGKIGTFVDSSRWNLIQKLFPERCKKRLEGEDDDLETPSNTAAFSRIISKEGEVRDEYEKEMKKIRTAEENEFRKTAQLIEQLKEEDTILEEQYRRQQFEDEMIAKKLQEEFNKSKPSPESPMMLRTSQKVSKGKKSPKNSQQATQNSKLITWLSPPRQLRNGQKENCPIQELVYINDSSDQERQDRALALSLQRELNQTRK